MLITFYISYENDIKTFLICFINKYFISNDTMSFVSKLNK